MLFSLYVNELPSVCTANVIMYADDAVVFVHGKDEMDVASKLTEQMQRVSDWQSQNCLTLNTEKTVVMYFTNRGKRLNYQNIFIDGKVIKHVDEFTYLGVTLDQILKKHVNKLRNTLKFSLSKF